MPGLLKLGDTFLYIFFTYLCALLLPGSGTLDRDEWTLLYQTYRPKASVSEARLYFELLDHSGQGFLDPIDMLDFSEATFLKAKEVTDEFKASQT